MPPALYVFFGAMLILILALVAAYNSLSAKRRKVQMAWRDVEEPLKRRYDLTPNLVEVIGQYAASDQVALEAAKQARRTAMAAATIEQRSEADKELGRKLGHLLYLANRSPSIKANEAYAQFRQELVETEKKIEAARKAYNELATAFNQTIKKFPSSMVAGLFGLKAQPLFAVEG